MNKLGLTLAALLLSSACAADGGSDTDYDQAELQRYRSALPTHAQLDAPRNTPTTSTALGEPAIYPHASAEIVLGINGAVGVTIEILEAVTAVPPTFYDSSTSEFVWGPWEDDGQRATMNPHRLNPTVDSSSLGLARYSDANLTRCLTKNQ